MLQTYVLLCLSAFAAGIINSIAGGGTILTFPVLMYALGDVVDANKIANATSTLALVPGSIASISGYRREWASMRRWAFLLAWPSIAGGAVGSLLLVLQPDKVFAALVPWMILGAALLFALQPQISKWIGVGKHHESPSRATMAAIIFFQFLVSVYGGYFGAGAGILMLAALALMGFENIHEMNALKATLGALINVVAVGVFMYGNIIHWPFAIAMAISAAIGGFCGSSVARTIDKRIIRNVVVVIGFSLAAWYFYQRWSQ